MKKKYIQINLLVNGSIESSPFSAMMTEEELDKLDFLLSDISHEFNKEDAI